MSLAQIARRTGLSRNTVKKWLKAAEVIAPRYRRVKMPGKLARFQEGLLQALQAAARRPKRERRTAKALHAEIKAQGYTGGHTVLTDFIRNWRQQAGANAPTRAFVLVAYPSPGHEMLFDAHTRSFQGLGGIPRRGIYDNMETAVDRLKKGKGRVLNARCAVLCSHYLFDPDFCNVASGWEKGVEKTEQDSRRRIWQEAGNVRFASPAKLNAWLPARCRALRQTLAHPESGDAPLAEMLEHEQAHLMPRVSPLDGYVEEPGRVSSTCLVTAARNHYSVPCELAGKLISKRFYRSASRSSSTRRRSRATRACLIGPHAR